MIYINVCVYVHVGVVFVPEVIIVGVYVHVHIINIMWSLHKQHGWQFLWTF